MKKKQELKSIIPTQDLKNTLWLFFEEPASKFAFFVRYFIIILILYSSSIASIQLLGIISLENYSLLISNSEYLVLGIFTVEFFLRFFSSPSKKNFLLDKFTWIDALAIFPFYLGIDNLAFLRILRILRLLRVFKLLKNTQVLNFFKVRNTIISKVTPVVLLFMSIKAIIFALEKKGYWFGLGSLDVLFTIMGFALGIVISNKIGTTYAKYIEIRKNLSKLHGKLISLSANINLMAQEKKMGKKGIKIVHD